MRPEMRKEGAISASIDVTVAFHDIDIIGVMWHGHYLKYLETARWALMDRLDFGYDTMAASGYAWPIVEMHVKYLHAARMGEHLNVRASLIEWENRITVNYLVTRAADKERLARGKSVQVAVDAKTLALQFVTPEPLLARVKQALMRNDLGTA
ncbi:thioesterase [Steroidobacter agaridevorans]|uniref:Thioesterase n=1 Tax=Steroidobacter agaridevorans TaxID=2695856 RepID=A0A829Y662_9GAMM|nr:acyl-CoA thioesterase [Steroidobacter agaridevorans]GFE78707.1 thioesterase [Steroidobacter agaridevorans]